MSNFVIYLKLQPYLKQWLVHSLGEPVEFPPKSYENMVIRRFLQKRPKDLLPELDADDLTAVYIPDSKAKPPQYYNYLGKAAKAAVIEVIEDLFRQNLWNEIRDLTVGHKPLNKTIFAWCEMHGIDPEYGNTVRQKYYRMRNAYNKKGIFLGKLTKERTDD